MEKLIVGLEAKVSELKEDLDASNKKLRLVSQFPVIGYEHKTINETGENSLSRFLSETGSTEIAKIVEANNMRIAILEEQNDQLRKRLESYKQFQTHKTTYIVSFCIVPHSFNTLGNVCTVLLRMFSTVEEFYQYYEGIPSILWRNSISTMKGYHQYC